ncbi:MAG: diguanylate cyclase domain-containing protein [Burkholderiales bacterium]
MTHLAQHHVLTDLPNRLLLNDRVTNAIALARRYGRQFALLFLDLDGFKAINDTLGHGRGDRLLISVACRLADSVRASDTVCRHGGDEFVVLLSEVSGAADAAASATTLLRTLAEPHDIDGHQLAITTSIGISIYPRDVRDGEALLRCPDSAMYRTKRSGRNGYAFFTAS